MATHLAAAKELDSVREFKGCVAAVNKVPTVTKNPTGGQIQMNGH